MNAPGNIDVPLGLAEDVLALPAASGATALAGAPGDWRADDGRASAALARAGDEGRQRHSGAGRQRSQLEDTSDCIRCGSCVEARPMGLLPSDMAANIRKEALGEAVSWA